MNDDLGEFVGKGFAMLRDRLKAVEARKMPTVIHGVDAVVDYKLIASMMPPPIPGAPGVVDYNKIEAMIPDPVKGDDGVVDYEKIRLMIPDPVPGKNGKDAVVDYVKIRAMIPEPIPGDPGEDAVVDYEKVRRMIPPAIEPRPGVDGDDGLGIADAKVDTRGHLILTLTDGTTKDAGKVKGRDGQRFEGMIAGGPSTRNPSGIATLDFAGDSNIATAAITGLSEITETSVVTVQMRIEATDDNSVNDLLIDPIRVTVSAYTVGVGFTIYGTMDHGPAQGLYRVNWALA